MRLMLATFVLALVFCSSAWAATATYAASSTWWSGQSASTSYSSGWVRNLFYKSPRYFDTTVTFIDNVSYGWHNTLRGSGILDIWWFSSAVKKAHCHSNVTASAWGACTAYS